MTDKEQLLWEFVEEFHAMILKKYNLDCEYKENSETESLHTLAMVEEKIIKFFYQCEPSYENFSSAIGYAYMAIAHWNKAMHSDVANRIRIEFLEYLDKVLAADEITITDWCDHKRGIERAQ